MKATRALTSSLTLFLGGTLFSSTAFGQVSIGVTIGTPPPPIRYEEAPPPPPPPPPQQMGFVWVQGFWAPEGGRYVWRPGRWMQPPDGDARWHAARWEQGDHGYRYREGYWEHHGGPDHHRDRHDDDDHHGNGHAYGHDKHDHDHD
ncbi:MAG TPA: YXWGXW repeat-containing protein [Edaphobacter sp.]